MTEQQQQQCHCGREIDEIGDCASCGYAPEMCKECINCKTCYCYEDLNDETICSKCEEGGITIQKIEARKEILSKRQTVDDVQRLLHENHTESNCDCGSSSGTEMMYSNGAGDMEICLDCFGAKGCVY